MYSLVLMAALSTGGEAPAFFFRHGCHGCYGGCYGGCHGCNGCWGGRFSCHGCYGGCYGGCHGCYGGCYGGYSAGYGCSGGCYGGCHGCYGVPVAPGAAMPTGPARSPAEPVPAPRKDDDKKTSAASPAKLIVELPADAKLYVDDQLMKTASAQRAFSTPNLQRGQAYYYMLRAEVDRDGKTLQETKRVIVRAGETVRAAFPDLGALATARADAELEP